MLQYLFDTDHLTLYDHADVTVWRHFSAVSWGSVGISAVTVEESLRGRLLALSRHTAGPLQVQAYGRLLAALSLFPQFDLVPFDLACENQYQHLRGMSLRIGSQDSRIGAVALVHRLVLVTRNRRDFGRIPGLLLEDWSV